MQNGKEEYVNRYRVPGELELEFDHAVARKWYVAPGVDTNAVLAKVAAIPIVLHCRQDDKEPLL